MTTIDIDFKELDNWLSDIAIKASELSTFKKKVAITLTETIALGFKAQQDPYSNKWEAHSPLTTKTYIKEYNRPPPHQILTHTGVLNKSIRYIVATDGVILGTNVKYAYVHQHGGKTEWVLPANGKKNRSIFLTVPPRPFLPTAAGGLPKKWREDIERVFKDVFLPKK